MAPARRAPSCLPPSLPALPPSLLPMPAGLQQDPPEGVNASPQAENIMRWVVEKGRAGAPWGFPCHPGVEAGQELWALHAATLPRQAACRQAGRQASLMACFPTSIHRCYLCTVCLPARPPAGGTPSSLDQMGQCGTAACSSSAWSSAKVCCWHLGPCSAAASGQRQAMPLACVRCLRGFLLLTPPPPPHPHPTTTTHHHPPTHLLAPCRLP